MQRKKILIAFVAISLLLVSIIVLTFFVKQNSLLDNKKIVHSFFIKNRGNKSHEVFIEAFNSKNTSIFNESYISAPKEEMRGQFPTTLAPGTYIEVTLDNNITKTQIVSMDFSDGDSLLLIDIDMYPNDPLVLGTAVP